MTTWNSLVMGVRDWWNSDRGRRVVKWALSVFSLMIAQGMIPLDTAVGPFSLGQLLLVFGLNIPSAPPLTKNTTLPVAVATVQAGEKP